ncbi:MAG TPA: helix-turn-helix transcriptional regulator [Planktothrix sp.]|jgi:transcriptional regulator with XRE-family HTH domain
MTKENPLGTYLKDRRTKLDPAAFGVPLARRRTPGLRREEVAQRANLSATWYTWLEQGRGGAPSADVLDRIAHALMLTEVEREHLFLIGLGRPPAPREKAIEGITFRIQRVIDALEFSPAIVRTSIWDIVAWNSAAAAVFGQYGDMPPEKRNVIRLMFTNSHIRDVQQDWEAVARYVVGGFRADAARAGRDVTAFVEEMCRLSPEFAKFWSENDVIEHTEGTKPIKHPVVGLLMLEFSGFSIDGRPDLHMVVYSPATEEDKEKIRQLLKMQASTQ